MTISSGDFYSIEQNRSLYERDRSLFEQQKMYEQTEYMRHYQSQFISPSAPSAPCGSPQLPVKHQLLLLCKDI